jgi:hypothetical protein
MSVFEPKVVLNLLKNLAAISPINKNAFERSWTVNVGFFGCQRTSSLTHTLNDGHLKHRLKNKSAYGKNPVTRQLHGYG